MSDQIFQLVKEYGQQVVVDNKDVPENDKGAIMAEASKTVTEGLQNVMAGGGLQNILDMFTGNGKQEGAASLLKNPIVTMMIGHFISKLTGKFNMNAAQASQVANQLIPNVLNGLVNRTASSDPSDQAFNLTDLIGSLTGNKGAGSGFDFQGLLEQFTGAKNAQPGESGGFNLQDLINTVTKGAQEKKAEESKNGGGIADLIQGFFGK